MFRLTKSFHFEAAHSLPHLPDGHKCRRPHGHSYKVELVLAAKVLDARGFAGVDYGELDAFRDYLNDNFDHRDLNEVMTGGGQSTTAERLAMHFYGWAKARWPGLERVRLYETPTTCVEYYPDEPPKTWPTQAELGLHGGAVADVGKLAKGGERVSGLLPDFRIREIIGIEPFAECQARPGVISYGVSSYGYDCRLGYKFKVFTNVYGALIDPKDFRPAAFVDEEVSECTRHSGANYVIIPPNSFALAESLETFRIPRSVLTVCVGKSTYARCGIIVNVTPLEPEWEGKVTIEISNTTPLPARVYAGEGIMQLIFLQAQDDCRVSYADKKGKYQAQAGLTLPRVDGGPS